MTDATSQPPLFGNVYLHDNLAFWKGKELDYRKVRDFAGLNANDVSRMAGVAKASVRYDTNVPREVKEHLENIANICNLVFEFFDSDLKTKIWLQTPNPMLGNASPRDMLRLGRYNKLLRFVTQALEEGRNRDETSQGKAAAST